MNFKSLRKNSQVYVWVAAVLFSLAFVLLLVFRFTGPLVYDPVVLEGRAPKISGKEYIQINDSRILRQSFHAPTINLSQIGLTIENINGAKPDALVFVRILDFNNKSLKIASTNVGSLRKDEPVIMPLFLKLEKGEKYVIQIETKGIGSKESLAVAHEVDGNALRGEYAEMSIKDKQNKIIPIKGNIGFQILQSPTKQVVFDSFTSPPYVYVIVFYLFALALAFVLRKKIEMLLSRIAQPILLKEKVIPAREIVIAVIIGSALALFVTMSYFTQIQKISTMGDVQRALVYRGVARDSLLQNRELGLWDPYLCGGEPLLANMESAQLDPFFLLVLLLGENLGTRLSVSCTLAIGFVGVFILARRYANLKFLPAILAAAIFPFAGFQMLAFVNGNYAWIPVGWIPWVVYFFLASFKNIRAVFAVAIFLAFIFFGGSLHMTIYAILACALLGLFMAIFYRSFRPVLMLILAGMIFVPLVGIKIFPVAELQAVTGEFSRPEPFIQPWSWLPKMFMDRQQLTTPAWRFAKTGENYRWIEYGTYCGVIPVILFLIGAWKGRRNKFIAASFCSAIVLLFMTFGQFPWTILNKLPFLYGPLRNPQRARVIFLLFFGVVAAYGLSVLAKKIPSTIFKKFFLGLVVVIVLLDLASFHSGIFPGLFKYKKPIIQESQNFVRIRDSYTDEDNGYYKVSYENYLANQGVTDMCMPYMAQRGIFGRGLGTTNQDKPYLGEAWFSADGRVEEVITSNNLVKVKGEAKSEGWLMINQNFFPGWRTKPVLEITNKEGLTAARVPKGNYEIDFYYRPVSYGVGFWMSLLTLLCFIALGLKFSWTKERE